MTRTENHDDEWVRMPPDQRFGGLPGIFTTRGEWEVHDVDIATFGLLDLRSALIQAKASGQCIEFPKVAGVHMSLLTPGEVQFLEMMADNRDPHPPVLAAGVFVDDHPAEWVSGLAEQLCVFLAIGDRGPSAFTTLEAWIDTWLVGIVAVAQMLTADGITITGPNDSGWIYKN